MINIDVREPAIEKRSLPLERRPSSSDTALAPRNLNFFGAGRGNAL